MASSSWWTKSMGLIRIAFGLLWAIAAIYKWQPGFINNVPHYFTHHMQGQLPIAQTWITLWANIVQMNPQLFGYIIAISETALALALILGLFNNLTYICGFILSLGIWSAAEGFGGPYRAGATDIGTAIVYAFVFASLFFATDSRYYSIDRYLLPKLGPLHFLASTPHTSLASTKDIPVPDKVTTGL
ncbi:hypothetical protein KDH_79210 [Dictyobacter sp. S3.2.2.5]|uniref:TQO small subunit DoxD domain-containing protein n=1 Tax=Dictyobacter halimunensis TaxID=3026934 RepID=A0ABQ6G4R2_9CHLR|nr:hypothetical protein KDH_79210 [Dictyobacter sp. S3.2.2.5]